jgi:hypothetical protein
MLLEQTVKKLAVQRIAKERPNRLRQRQPIKHFTLKTVHVSPRE